MFSLNPSAYTTPQHFSPYSYSYNDYSNELLARGYLHALQQQQTRERQEAQYRAQLEEAARRRRLAEGMRRRNQHFDPFFMTGSEPYESLFQPRPRPQSTPHEYSRPVRRDAFEDHSPQMERRCESVNAKQQERQAFVVSAVIGNFLKRTFMRLTAVGTLTQFEIVSCSSWGKSDGRKGSYSRVHGVQLSRD